MVSRRRSVPTDDDGFDAFFRAQHPKVLAMAIALTGVREVAVDIAQEAMSRALRDWATVRELDAPQAWVRRVTTNLVNDWHRGNARFARYAPRLVDDRPTVLVDPESERFWSAVRALPDVQRSVIALYYLEDRSVADVAEQLEIPVGTVKSSLSKARAALASVLGVRDDEVSDAPPIAPVISLRRDDEGTDLSEWAP